MNQDMVKEKLLSIKSDVVEFKVIFSGKTSKKVNGLYKTETSEIIIHNKNFKDDNELIYTAIHEFAHHIQFSESPSPVTSRVHTTRFWDIFHTLLYMAEKKGIYKNLFLTHPEFVELTRRIKDNFIKVHGNLVLEFGKILLEAHILCDKYNVNFFDYADRVLKIKHTDARSLIRLSRMNVNPEFGYENMKTLARIRDENLREKAEEELAGDATPDMIRTRYLKKSECDDPLETLSHEKIRIERTIETLKKRLIKIDQKISELQSAGS